MKRSKEAEHAADKFLKMYPDVNLTRDEVVTGMKGVFGYVRTKRWEERQNKKDSALKHGQE